MLPTGVEPQPARGDEPEDDCHRLVVAEHQRRQPVAGPETVAAAHASLALDRDAQLLERFDVPADSAPIDTKVVGDLAPGDERPGLEQLEQLEESRGWCDHALQ
jgi:hypothetical protein